MRRVPDKAFLAVAAVALAVSMSLATCQAEAKGGHGGWGHSGTRASGDPVLRAAQGKVGGVSKGTKSPEHNQAKTFVGWLFNKVEK